MRLTQVNKVDHFNKLGQLKNFNCYRKNPC